MITFPTFLIFKIKTKGKMYKKLPSLLYGITMYKV